MEEWQIQSEIFKFGKRFADDQAIFADTESKLQSAVQLLYNTSYNYPL
jgi:hypothetical protein